MSTAAFGSPQKMGRIILLGLEEVIGRGGLEAVLQVGELEEAAQNVRSGLEERTFSFEAVSRLHQALEELYGPRGGRGLALRVGRSCFKYGLKEYGSMLGLTETAFRLLPLPTKLHAGAGSFAGLFNKYTDQQVRVAETDSEILWHIERCPLCWGRVADEPVCHLAVGLLQEALYWLSGGKVFQVEEIACHARGDERCTILIQKKPLT
ncbi:MAG: 4-vinyl reductase [Chloroflexi bacterium]|nr:4-vinyl reductase [Chloroflexota bacterium]